MKRMNQTNKINPVYLISLILIAILLMLLSLAINDWQPLGDTFKEKISIGIAFCAMLINGILIAVALWGGEK